jgi:hypothetical protein
VKWSSSWKCPWVYIIRLLNGYEAHAIHALLGGGAVTFMYNVCKQQITPEILGSHSNDYGEYYFLRCYTVWCGRRLLMFWRNVLLPSSGLNSKLSKLLACLAYFCTMKMEAVCSSERSFFLPGYMLWHQGCCILYIWTIS